MPEWVKRGLNRMESRKHFLKLFGWVALVNILARLLGFVREVILAYYFGASAATDAFLLAYTIPNFLYLVVGGALTTAIIPYLVGETQRQERWDKANALMNQLLLGFTLLLIFGELWPLTFVSLLSPEAPATTLAEAARLYQVMLPSAFFLMAGSIFTGMLNAHHRFQLAAVAYLSLNVTVILFLWAGANLIGIAAAAWGALVGAVSFAFLQVGQLYRIGYRYRPRMSHPETGRIFLVSIPIALGGAVMPLYALVSRFFAGGLPEGSIAAFNYGMMLMQLPLTVLVGTFANLLFPSIAENARGGQYSRMADTFARGTCLSILSLVPLAAYMSVFASEIVQLLLGYGAFSAQDAYRTASALAVLVWGLPFHALNLFWLRFFNSLEDNWRPVLASLTTILLVNGLLSWFLRPSIGLNGLAAAVSVSGLLNTVWLWGLIQTKLPLREHVRTLYILILKVVLSTGVATAVSLGIKNWLSSQIVSWSHLPVLFVTCLHLLAGGVAGMVVLLLGYRLLRVKELVLMRRHLPGAGR